MPASVEAVAVEADADDRLPVKPRRRRLERLGRLSMIATVWPASTSCVASDRADPPTSHDDHVHVCDLRPVPDGGDATHRSIRSTRPTLHDAPRAGDAEAVFVGRPLATTEEHHQRLRKTDRARGVRVRRDLVDRVRDARRSCSSSCRSPGIGRARATSSRSPSSCRPARHRRHELPPDDLRLPERRRHLRRVAARTSAQPVARRGRVAPRRLRADRGRVGLGRCRRHHSAFPELRDVRACVLCLGFIVLMTLGEPARPEGVGPALRRPDLHLRRCRSVALIVVGLCRSYSGDLDPLPVDHEALDEITAERRAAHRRDRCHPAAGLLVGRRRAHGRRGDLQRRAGVPQARVEERRDAR